MLKKTIAALAAGIGLSIASIGANAATGAVTTAELAFRHARTGSRSRQRPHHDQQPGHRGNGQWPATVYHSVVESCDGTVSFEVDNGISRMKTVQEAKGHGLKAWPYASNFNGAANQDGVVYYPTLGAAGHPLSGNDRHVNDRLVDLTPASTRGMRRRGSLRNLT